LIVDDQAANVLLLERILQTGGYTNLTQTTDPRKVLEFFTVYKPDLILLDLMMPEMDGFQVVAALQKEPGWRDIPVIVITSLDLDAKDRERLNSGVQSVLIKEMFRPAELVDRIRRLVHRKPIFSSGMEAAL
jgi:CheY-like chemotaxis protein